MTYASYTRDTSEPLKRIAHKRRFQQIVSLVSSPSPGDVVLDYGCGDGHLFSHFLNSVPRANLVGYDPNQGLLSEAESGVSKGSILTSDIDWLKTRYPHAFSLVYCVEVCEHLTDPALNKLFDNIRALASPAARIVFGVPIETGLSGFLKSLYRVSKGGRGASLSDAVRALFGINIERQITDAEWFGWHTGFDHKRLRRHLERNGFAVQRTHCLPAPLLGSLLNNEIYFVCARST